ncbi:MAG: hypothetical protein ISR69_06695 [Gammaproteobacteria bacterium]|nr:hypothetical protein [Gammaproteobacteria bacterium]
MTITINPLLAKKKKSQKKESTIVFVSGKQGYKSQKTNRLLPDNKFANWIFMDNIG